MLYEVITIDRVIEAAPDIIAHNIETVRRLTPLIRSVARYEVSLGVIRHIAIRGVRSKSGLMLGLGETEEEVIETLNDRITSYNVCYTKLLRSTGSVPRTP